MTKILLVDDDPHIRELASLYLTDEGFEIIEAASGAEAWDYVADGRPFDMVVLDIMMPHMDGWELCRKLRARGDFPILMITAKGEMDDKTKGFRLGTDDYLTKPFDPLEMVLRVKALLKRYRIAASRQVELGDLTIDKIGYQVVDRASQESFTIPLKEFELLYLFASRPGQLFTRSQLIQHVWGMDYEGDERTIDTHISRLRERFAAYEATSFRIVTLRGLGYRLEVRRD